MDLAKFVIALSIGLILTLFVSDVITVMYNPPKIDTSSCYDLDYSSYNLCSNIITQKCGTYSYSSGMNYDTYYSCKDVAMDSAEYLQCEEDAGDTMKNCVSKQMNKLTNYQLISFWIYAILGIIFILTGLLIIQFRGIGSGLILGGIFIILFSGIISLFAQLTSIMSSVSSLLTSEEKVSSVDWIQVSRMIVSFIILVILIVVGYFKVDREPDSA